MILIGHYAIAIFTDTRHSKIDCHAPRCQLMPIRFQYFRRRQRYAAVIQRRHARFLR